MMHPNAKTLALRDPALATLMGAIDGSDFGDDYGDDYGFEFGDEMGDEYGFEFGDEYGAEAVAASRAPVRVARPVAPPPAVAAKLWAAHRRASAHTERRARLIEPNKGSKIKVEKYIFSLSQALTLGAASAISISQSPDTNLRPQRVTMNAPTPGFVTVTNLKVANVSVTVGGIADAASFSNNAVNTALDMPTLSPSNKATVDGNYTGYVPPGYVGAAAFMFVTSLIGPATIVA